MLFVISISADIIGAASAVVSFSTFNFLRLSNFTFEPLKKVGWVLVCYRGLKFWMPIPHRCKDCLDSLRSKGFVSSVYDSIHRLGLSTDFFSCKTDGINTGL